MALSDVDDLSEPKPQWLESGKNIIVYTVVKIESSKL